MKLLLRCLFLLLVLTPAILWGQKTARATSPDGQIVFAFSIEKGKPGYTVHYKGKPLLNRSPLSLQFHNGGFTDHIKLGRPGLRDTTEDYTLLLGKIKNVHTQYRRLILPLLETVAPFHKVNLVVKIFNDGLAFRYEFPQQIQPDSLILVEEQSSFNPAADAIVQALLLPSYTSSHEGHYTKAPFSRFPADTLMDMPALLSFPNGVYMGITEAALLDYAGMYLVKKGGLLTSRLSPLPGQNNVKVKAAFPHKSPWRVMLISDRVGALIESNIITTLNEPSKIADMSWIKGGKTTFPWWNGNVTPDSLNAPGNNFVTAQYYIDFCARNKLQFHSVVEYGLHQWYTDDGVGFQPGPNPDVTKPVPGLDMKQICDYASTKGVGIRVWVHWAALYPKLDSAFAIFEKWGLKGMMVDFMDRDDQEMVNIQTEMLEKAAKHHLHIQFHGAYKNTGINRTYPNEFTREGTLNYETDKWTTEGLSPDHDIDIPFTRMLAGSTDYHLGGFRAATQSQYKLQYTRPLVLGTRCHMLAMYLVLENYLQMVCDYPAAYEGQPGFEWIQDIPTTWDETKVPGAQPGEFITIARKSNNDWYVGTINNTTAREINVPLNFLDDGNYTATIYTDAADVASNPDHLEKQTKTVTGKDVLKLAIAAGGGQVMHIRKLSN